MAYQTYITEAIVCGKNVHQTSDCSYTLFTRSMGVVYAHAQSVREERSKHRYALQECSYARVTLVHGKSGWRVTGAEPIQNFYTLAETRAERAFVRNILLLIRRLIQGETAHENLFNDVVYACTQVRRYSPDILEVILTLRIVHMLGYVADEQEIRVFVEQPLAKLSIDTLESDTKKKCTLCINNALKESHL